MFPGNKADSATKTGEFSEKFQGEGGGGIFNPKFVLLLEHEIDTNLQHNFPEMRRGGKGHLELGTEIHPFW